VTGCAQLGGATERFLIDAVPSAWSMSVDAGEGCSPVLLVDDVSGDEVAEIFHCDMHAVAQTPEQAVFTARLFAASSKMLAALIGLVAVRPSNAADDEPQHAAWVAASDAIAAAGVAA
jgi:hypothetical protein